MKIKATILFQLFQFRWTFVVFYAMILLVFGINLISTSGIVDSNISISGTEYSCAVCIFIIGVMFMRVQFPFFLQNGISRRTTFLTSLLYGGLVTAGMTILTALLALGSGLLSPRVTTSFYHIYAARYDYLTNTPAIFWEGLLWSFTMNLACYLMGLFLSAMLYRLNRLLKIIVFGGLGAIFCFILPVIDIGITDGEIFRSIMHGILFAMGCLAGRGNPYFAVVTFLIIGALFVGGYSLFLRRATVKQ